MDPSDKTLAAGLALAKEGQERARLVAVEKARREYEAYEKSEAARQVKLAAQEDDLVDSFFGDVQVTINIFVARSHGLLVLCDEDGDDVGDGPIHD
jgi:hypothetical protein